MTNADVPLHGNLQSPRPRRSLARKALRVLVWFASVVVILLVGVAIWIGPMVYRAFYGYDIFETSPPAIPPNLASPSILVFSKTNGFREDRSIAVANAALRDLARAHGWGIFETENAAVFNPRQLSRFRATVWNNVSGNVLTAQQQQALQTFIENGGGFVGIHGAGGDISYRWRWYVEKLIGAQFVGHTMFPQIQNARIRIEDPGHPAMAGLPRDWVRADEWYSFDRSVRTRGYHVLATLDERSYHGKGLFLNDIRMGGDHPLIWTHCVGRGHVFYSALGHAPQAYNEPLHRLMLANAIAWAARDGNCRDGI